MKQGRDQYRWASVDWAHGVRARLWGCTGWPEGSGVWLWGGFRSLLLVWLACLFCVFAGPIGSGWTGIGGGLAGGGTTRFSDAGLREVGRWVRLFRVPPSWLWIGAWEAWCASGRSTYGTADSEYGVPDMPHTADTPLALIVQNGLDP
ncbi:MAG: hypothetical protein WCO60_12945 [Verrucomicrobiota bacterium]